MLSLAENLPAAQTSASVQSSAARKFAETLCMSEKTLLCLHGAQFSIQKEYKNKRLEEINSYFIIFKQDELEEYFHYFHCLFRVIIKIELFSMYVI